MLLAVLIFAAALAVIATERVDRTKVALVGAMLVVLSQTIDQEHAIEAIDWQTIGLLAGMMLIVRVTEPTGIYTFLAIRAGQLARGRPFAVVMSLALSTALLSAFLVKLIEIIASNIGGTATLIGDPPNILIAGATELSFSEFAVNLAPISALAFAVVTGMLYLVFRKRLRIAPEARDRVMELEARRSIEDVAELKRTLPVLVITILAFFVHGALGVEPATVALTGATVMLLLTRQSVEEALRGIEWPTLFFFVGLFVMVGALEETGAIKEVADAIADVTNGDRTAELMGILWASALGSGVVDNIPFTATMIPVVEQIQGPGGGGDDAYWWALSLGACFGGNLTLVAAAANVAAAGMAERAGRPIGFVTFLKVGVPATLVSMLLASGYIALRYV
jgi:Na+/H+ antiporter NhaD/arsenite permease-like protein